MKENDTKKRMTLLLAPQELTLYGAGFNLAKPIPLAIGVLQGALRSAGHGPGVKSAFDFYFAMWYQNPLCLDRCA